MLYMVVEQLLSLFVGHKRRNRLHERAIAVNRGDQGLSGSCPLEIHAISARPFPCVVDVENGLHVSLAHLGKEVVEAPEDGVIIHARLLLERRADTCRDAVRTVTAHEDTEVGHTEGLERIKLSLKAFAIAAYTLAAEDGTIPEVGSDEV